MNTFDELKINEDIMRSIKELGFTTPFPIQAQAIPELLQGNDVLVKHIQEQEKLLHLEFQCYKTSSMEEEFRD